MGDLKIIKFDAAGPADTGLVPWDPIDPAGLESGTPVQSGHLYFNDESLGLMAGVWHCTPNVGHMEPYAVDEFMYVLEGSVTMETEDGTETTIRAGESFIVPRGLVCKWKQTDDIRKFFVIFDDPAKTPIKDPSSLKVILPKNDDAVGGIDLNDPSAFIGDIPSQHVHSYYEDASGQFSVGLWDSEGFRTSNPIH